MKTKPYLLFLAALFFGSIMLYAAEGGKPETDKDKPAMDAGQTQKLNQQQRLERLMTQINQAYQAKDYQKMERLIKRYANARQNRYRPADKHRQMQREPMNRRNHPLVGREGQWRQRPGALQEPNRLNRPRAQAGGPRQGRALRFERGRGQQSETLRQAPRSWAGNFKAKMRRWAENHPVKFRQFLNRYLNRHGRWNQPAPIRSRADRPNFGYGRNFRADRF